MNWRGSRSASRERYLAKYDAEEVERYDAWITQLTQEDDQASLADIQGVFQFHSGMAVLDVGTGTSSSR